tara:strand:+ start:72 stop:824 length:753 start_codon:yes stop_codon:yes gene_type:complete
MKNLFKDWEFNVLGIDNYKRPGKLKPYYDYIIKNHRSLDGDICEVGVYRGFSVLATAMLLKELNSDKIIWGYDSFEGFPSYHSNDALENFDILFKKGKITKEHYEDYKLNHTYKSFVKQTQVNVKNISTSEDFSKNSLRELERKIIYLGLDNIKLIKGDFSKTMNESDKEKIFFASLIDCDLYEGYKKSLPFVYNRLSNKGYMYLDEYYSLKFPGAKIATDEFFDKKKDKPFKYETYSGDFERWAVIKDE